jgi:hypothetical protein
MPNINNSNGKVIQPFTMIGLEQNKLQEEGKLNISGNNSNKKEIVN